MIHTPGHTPGSQCFFVDGRLVAATRCSSTAAAAPICPAAIPDALYESLTQKLAIVPDDAILYPGHHVLARAGRADGRRAPRQLRVPAPHREQWMTMFGSDGF